jgi:hypothetical protein
VARHIGERGIVVAGDVASLGVAGDATTVGVVGASATLGVAGVTTTVGVVGASATLGSSTTVGVVGASTSLDGSARDRMADRERERGEPLPTKSNNETWESSLPDGDRKAADAYNRLVTSLPSRLSSSLFSAWGLPIAKAVVDFVEITAQICSHRAGITSCRNRMHSL